MRSPPRLSAEERVSQSRTVFTLPPRLVRDRLAVILNPEHSLKRTKRWWQLISCRSISRMGLRIRGGPERRPKMRSVPSWNARGRSLSASCGRCNFGLWQWRDVRSQFSSRAVISKSNGLQALLSGFSSLRNLRNRSPAALVAIGSGVSESRAIQTGPRSTLEPDLAK